MCAIDVALNEKREEITRLEDEIRADEPAVLQMSLDELRSLNDHLAEDLRILVDKFPPPTSSPKAMDRKLKSETLVVDQGVSGIIRFHHRKTNLLETDPRI